jgi:hypothetical protein
MGDELSGAELEIIEYAAEEAKAKMDAIDTNRTRGRMARMFTQKVTPERILRLVDEVRRRREEDDYD